jgi:hypothetical protein
MLSETGAKWRYRTEHDAASPGHGRYQLAYGHARLEAARMAGITSASFTVMDLDDETMLRMMADENITQLGKDRFATYKEATVAAATHIMANILADPERVVKFIHTKSEQEDRARLVNEIAKGGSPGRKIIARFYTPKGHDGEPLSGAKSTLDGNSIRAALQVYHDTGELAASLDPSALVGATFTRRRRRPFRKGQRRGIRAVLRGHRAGRRRVRATWMPGRSADVLPPLPASMTGNTMRDDLHELPTPRTTMQSRYVCVLVWCTSCRHQRDADLQGLIDAGRGDVPLIHLKFRCSNCGSRLTDFVCTSAAAIAVQPWRAPDQPRIST